MNKIKFSAIELWNNLFFSAYNTAGYCAYICQMSALRELLNKNRALKSKHEGERCFIVLNAPSITDHDLEKLRFEHVLCVNHFYASGLYDTVCPSYYLACDTSFFSVNTREGEENHLREILRLTRENGAKCIFPSRFLGEDRDASVPENVFITYSKHKPTKRSIRLNMAGFSSAYSTVSLYAMSAALYMGFKKIYLLGYQLPPWKGGLMPHVHQNTEEELKTETRLVGDKSKHVQVGLHWQYYQAQLENYYMSAHAKRLGTEIYNCTQDTFVHAFPYNDFDKIFG